MARRSAPVVSPAVTDLEIALLRLDADLPAPAYAHPGDAGADLLTTVDVALMPGERALEIGRAHV